MLSKERMKLISYQFTVIFTISFVLTFPFPYHVIPDIGGLFAPIFEPINRFWIDLFNLKNVTPSILSDSTGLYVHLITLTLMSLAGSLIWQIYYPSTSVTVKQWFHRGISYYLSLTLLTYGFNKVFKWQFYFPEPNTLYTHVGDMTPDILYWSAIGTSYSYSFFSGIIEIIPALLLLFRRTRLIGGLVSVMVMINVVMINFGFDISVKVYSLFLLFCSILVIAPDMNALLKFFSGENVTSQKNLNLNIDTKGQLICYTIGKPVVIGLMFFEVLLPYFKTQNFNDDLFEKPYLNGAYTVNKFSSNNARQAIPKRFFIHRRGYFILEYQNEKKESFDLRYTNDSSQIQVIDSKDKAYLLSIDFNSDTILLSGIFKGHQTQLKATQINLSELPVKSSHFHWTIDSY